MTHCEEEEQLGRLFRVAYTQPDQRACRLVVRVSVCPGNLVVGSADYAAADLVQAAIATRAVRAALVTSIEDALDGATEISVDEFGTVHSREVR